jgi:hypothetical protein
MTGNNSLSPASDILCFILRDLLMADVTTPALTGMGKATCIKLEAKGKHCMMFFLYFSHHAL